MMSKDIVFILDIGFLVGGESVGGLCFVFPVFLFFVIGYNTIAHQ